MTKNELWYVMDLDLDDMMMEMKMGQAELLPVAGDHVADSDRPGPKSSESAVLHLLPPKSSKFELSFLLPRLLELTPQLHSSAGSLAARSRQDPVYPGHWSYFTMPVIPFGSTVPQQWNRRKPMGTLRSSAFSLSKHPRAQ